MIERLDQLTLDDFIELTCGNAKVLCCDGESCADIVSRAARIISEYKSIAMPAQAKMDLHDAEDESKLDMKEKCVRICMLLCAQNRPDLAKEVFDELEVEVELDAEKMLKRCRAMLNEIAYDREKLRDRPRPSAKRDQRTLWYSEIAWVMSTFKMSIDTKTINAAIYANLVNQATERAKRLAKMPARFNML